jgi:hypothetical protein
MNIIELTADNAESYSELIDRNVLESLSRSGHFGAVAAEEGHPLAAMIWQITDGHNAETGTSSEIVWMDATGDPVATEELLKTYKRRIDEAGVKSSSFVLDKELHKNSIKVLRDFGFTLSEGEGPDIYTSVGNLIKSPLARIKGNCDNIYELRTLKKRAFGECVRDCLSKTKRSFPEDLPSLGMGWFEPDVSCYSEMECTLNGMLLVHKMPDGALRVELLSSWGPGGETAVALMIKYAIENTFELYPTKTPVIIHRHDKVSLRLSSYCLPNVKGRPSIYGNRPEVQ